MPDEQTRVVIDGLQYDNSRLRAAVEQLKRERDEWMNRVIPQHILKRLCESQLPQEPQADKSAPAEEFVEHLRAIVEPLHELRAEEGSSVTIACDNQDFDGPANCVTVRASWTGWKGHDFTGDSLADALNKALEAKIAHEAEAAQAEQIHEPAELLNSEPDAGGE